VSYTKTIVCLANSKKFGSGRCVAGREVVPKAFGDWVRPVSARPSQEVSEEERQYENGQDPRVLDIIAVEMIRAQPEHHQQENQLIDPDYHWVNKGTVTWSQLQSAVEDAGGPLWINGYHSSNGINDGVPEQEARALPRSLYLVRPKGLIVTVAMEPGYGGKPPKRTTRARFKLRGVDYRFAVTDPVISRELDFGDTPFPDAVLCVSLPAEAVGGKCYKLVATVITPERIGGKS
jgi:hypothetical protein